MLSRQLRIASLFFILPLAMIGQDSQGIHVGQPKAYDNRTLNIMLEELNSQLAQMKVLDQAKLAAAIGTMQGMEVRESSTGTTVGLVGPYKKPDGTTVIPEQGKIPWNMDLGTFNSIGPTSQNYGMASQDLLGDQVSLQYQIFNLRMILDRSLTDRVHNGKPKLSAVLGIPVSLDPQRESRDSAAIVRVRIRRASAPPQNSQPYKGLSLVALMPQEKTYNSAALSKKSNAFGASAVAKVVQVGFSSIQRGQTYFMYRDNDTIAFEDRDGEETVFGWQFRPVLGRRSVAPGMRQMFAVIALPEEDIDSQNHPLEVVVETHWVKYQRSLLTTHPESLWFEKFGSLIGKPIPPPIKPTTDRRFPLSIPNTEKFQTELSPFVDEVSWVWVGKKEVLVSVEGKNFFSDTKVMMGGKTFDASNGLKIKSEKTFDLLVEGPQLSEAVIQGRYGSSIPLIRGANNRVNGGLEIESVERVTIEGHSVIDLTLSRKNGGELGVADLPHTLTTELRKKGYIKADVMLHPLITFGGTLLPGPYEFSDFDKEFEVNKKKEKKRRVQLRILVPSDLVKKWDGILTVYYPFWNSEWYASASIGDPNKYYTLIRWKAATEAAATGTTKENPPVVKPEEAKANDGTPKQATLFLLLDKFKSMTANSKLNVLLTSGQPLPLTPAANCPAAPAAAFCIQDTETALLRVAEEELGEQLLLKSDSRLFVIEIPAKKKEEAKKPEAAKVPEVNQYDSVWLATSFASAKKIEADGQELRTRVNSGKIEALLTRALTQRPGELDLTIEGAATAKDDSPATKVIRVRIVCRECEATKKEETKK